MEDAGTEVTIMMNIIVILVQTLDTLIMLVNVEDGEDTMEDAVAEVAIVMNIIVILATEFCPKVEDIVAHW